MKKTAAYWLLLAAMLTLSVSATAKKNKPVAATWPDGSVMDAGSCAIEGTCLIRTSKYLDEEGQEKLTRAVREALLTVDE